MRKEVIAAALCLAMAAPNIEAKPARRGYVDVKQPDGTTITVTRIGDEHSHITLDTEGRALLADDLGQYRPAMPGSDGMLVLANEAKPLSQEQISSVLKAGELRSPRRLARAAAAPSRAGLPQEGLGKFTCNFPTKGKVKSLVILVQYSDVKFTLSDPNNYFTEMLTKDDFSQYAGTGSCHKYFYDNSNGLFDPEFDVYGPVTLPEKQSYYGGNDSWGDDLRPWRMLTDAAEILKDEVNFADYDMDNDGYVDNVYIYYAGLGEAGDGSANTVWPHSWNITSATSTAYIYNGVRLDSYACSNEWEGGKPDGIGTFCHEFSHVLGLPDLYNTSSSTAAYTPCEWSVMDYGCYANDSRTPIGYSSFERNAMGWISPTLIDGPMSARLEALSTSNECYLIQTEKTNEFFLFENRQTTGWDKYIPGHGMLIWHIDFVQSVWDNNSPNNSSSHQYIDIVEANNSPSGTETALKGYPWPGRTNATEFTATTTPAFKSWSGKSINLPITEISEFAGVITFDVAGGNHDLATPTGLSVSDITPGGFTLSWDQVEYATDYYVNVYAGEEVVRQDISSEGSTSIAIDRLNAATDYTATVTAATANNRSEASEAVAVTTLDLTFDYLVPQALSPIEVNLEGFTAVWEPVEDAVDYLLTVSAMTDDVGGTATCGFGSGNAITLPNGWTISGKSTDYYSSSGNYGEAVPSLKMASDGYTLQTCEMPGNVMSISFWHKGMGNKNDVNTLVVDGLIGEDWVELDTLYPLTDTSSGITDCIDQIPSGVRAVRFTYNKISSGNVALDDVVITYGGGLSASVLPEYDGRSVGCVTQWHVSEILPDVLDYSYTVTAVNAEGTHSLPSDAIELNLMKTSGAAAIPTDADAEPQYYNLQGIRIAPEGLCPGYYIRRSGSKAEIIRL